MSRLFLQMERDEARKLQKQYYLEHGTTLPGLMLHHGIDPNDFLEKAHAIDYSALTPQPEARCRHQGAAGAQIHFHQRQCQACTGDRGETLGILDNFDDIFDIVAADYVPKPAGSTYGKFMSLNRVDTDAGGNVSRDLPRNLHRAQALGMRDRAARAAKSRRHRSRMVGKRRAVTTITSTM